MSDRELVTIDSSQFNTLDSKINALRGELQIIRERLGPVDKDKNLHQVLTHIERTLFDALLNADKSLIIAGFKLVAEAIANLQPLPQPQPKPLEVKFVFKVANDHQDETFSISIGGVTDAEGEPLPNQDGLTVDVKSSDDAVVAVSFDPTSKTGVASFGHSGVASLTASVTNAKGDILGSGAADFTVTTGDPAAVSDVKIAFSGLTEAPPEDGSGEPTP